jgi:hypothetical protein
MSKIIELMSAEDIREILEGLPRPICTAGFSDAGLYQLQLTVLTELNSRFCTLDAEKAPKLEDAWWAALEWQAVVNYGMSYYEDIEDV